ncbi:unnamed protein product [Leptidea sinapis]|uniref:Uncharacterized protein n=1 Tax=Leptidea sinapis TaxID=189913 RepID=A0A5E4PVP2_9NEOP|nr:unnamed protein product [Leptidea sinapis]
MSISSTMIMALTTKFLLLVIALVCSVDAYKILVVVALPGKSHGILGDGVVRHLTNAGHENNNYSFDDIYDF